MRSLPAERRSGFRRRQRAIAVHPRGVSRMQPTSVSIDEISKKGGASDVALHSLRKFDVAHLKNHVL